MTSFCFCFSLNTKSFEIFVNLTEIVSRDNLNLTAMGYYKLHFQADFLRFQRIMINERNEFKWPEACGRLLIGIRQGKREGVLECVFVSIV